MAVLPEPVWTTTQQIELDPSSICSTGVRPSYMTGYLLRLLEAHFGNVDNIVDDNLKQYIWAPKGTDAIDTKILIEPADRYEATALQQRPGLYVKRANVQTSRIAILDKAITHLKPNGNYEGENHFMALFGSHDIMCCARGPDGMAAERLAEEVFYMLLEYGPVIKKDIQANVIQTPMMAAAQKVEEDGLNYAVGVKFQWAFIHAWTLKPIAPILRDVRVTGR